MIYRVIVLYIVISVGLIGCTSTYQNTDFYSPPQRTDFNPPSPEPLGSCEKIKKRYFDCYEIDVIDIKDCQDRASNGNVLAMEKLANVYHNEPLTCSKFEDGKKSLEWWKKAREAGSSLAVQKLSRIYADGKIVPKNRRIADAYIKEGVEKGYDWAVHRDIYRKIRIGDKTAINDITKQAISGNCHAQSNLAYFYAYGRISPDEFLFEKIKYDVETNLTKSYFWSIIARSASKKNKYYSIYGIKSACDKLWRLNHKKKIQIPIDLIAKAEDAAVIWAPGKAEPNLPPPRKMKAKTPKMTGEPDKIIFPDIGEMDLVVDESSRVSKWKWFPITLPKLNRNTSALLNPAEIFEKANKYVWKVFSAKSKKQLMSANGISQGSAVAISEKQLITNCHIISGNPIIIVKHKDKFDVAQIVSGDSLKDQCVLEVTSQKLIPVNGIRAYSSLKIGEAVFTVGSPSGLDNSLGEGIISGLRNLKEQRLIQTTAQISPGSSGGGLFDQYGNLIGVTTFKLRDTQALNFAVAIEEYGE